MQKVLYQLNSINLLRPIGYVMHQKVQLSTTVRSARVLYLSENKQKLVAHNKLIAILNINQSQQITYCYFYLKVLFDCIFNIEIIYDHSGMEQIRVK
jgi:hypothetical protein